jgi:SAM-dependent methyltransferase
MIAQQHSRSPNAHESGANNLTYCFDIDGTLCTNTEGDYENALPLLERIDQVNSLYDAGHEIVLHTARGFTTGIDWRTLTERQLQEWGVRYHALHMGKPRADIYVDDKGVNVADFRMPETTPGTSAGARAVLQSASYIETTYSVSRAPQSAYPVLLASWLAERAYCGTGKLLDLGCGRGDHLRAFQQIGFRVAGADISPAAADLAPGIDVRRCDLEAGELPYPDDSFDFVFSKSVIEHMREPLNLLHTAWRTLRPGGIAVIMTPSWRHTYWGPFYCDHTHVTPFTGPSLQDALTLAGFESVDVRHFRQLPFLWRMPLLEPIVSFLSVLPVPYRPFQSAPWPHSLNTLIRFSKEVMLLGTGRKPHAAT